MEFHSFDFNIKSKKKKHQTLIHLNSRTLSHNGGNVLTHHITEKRFNTSHNFFFGGGNLLTDHIIEKHFNAV